MTISMYTGYDNRKHAISWKTPYGLEYVTRFLPNGDVLAYFNPKKYHKNIFDVMDDCAATRVAFLNTAEASNVLSKGTYHMYVYDIGFYGNSSKLVNNDKVNFNSPDNRVIGVVEHEIVNGLAVLEGLEHYNSHETTLDTFVSKIVSNDKTYVKNWTNEKELVSALNVDAESLKYVLYGKNSLYVILDYSNSPLYENRFDNYTEFIKSPFFATTKNFLKEVFGIEYTDDNQQDCMNVLKSCDYWNVYKGLTFTYFDEKYTISPCDNDPDGILVSYGNNSIVVSKPDGNTKTLLFRLTEKEYLLTVIDEENPYNSASWFTSKDDRLTNILIQLEGGESANVKIGFGDKTYECVSIINKRHKFKVHDNKTDNDYTMTVTKL